MFNNIPHELRMYAQFVLWKFEPTAKGMTKVPYQANGNKASHSAPQTWNSYDGVIAAYNAGGFDGIGFVLTASDPFAFIDLDEAKNQKDADLQKLIATSFNSYAERSPSGKGLHIILKGSVPKGRKTPAVEIYSQLRFMTLTGDVYKNVGINDCQTMLESLYNSLKPVDDVDTSGINMAQVADDAAIIEIATNAANGSKFNDLYMGNWEQYHPSQSEADLTLINIISFYTQNRDQIKRIFRMSQLGKRDKAQRDDYLKTLIDKSFDQLLPPINLPAMTAEVSKAIEQLPQKVEKQKETIKFNNPAMSVPPGLVGDIARFIHAQSPRQVPETALAGAIGLMAGIAGRAYNISGTGLNQYVILLATTGLGKEAMAKGINSLLMTCKEKVPGIDVFNGPSNFSSAQAATKHLAEVYPSFVTIWGEFGYLLQEIVNPRANAAQKSIKRFILDAYNKSGNNDVMSALAYSDRAKNTEAIRSPAFSILAEATPESFFAGLTENMIADGFLPRFTLIEVGSKRPYFNKNHSKVKPSDQLVTNFSTLAANAMQLNAQHKVVDVKINNDCDAMFDEFGMFCDDTMNNSNEEVKKQLWNRAHLKVLKLAGLIAVGCNPYAPVVTKDIGKWAIDMVLADVRLFLEKFDAGEIGEDNLENEQLVKVQQTISKYLTSAYSEVEKYCGRDSFLMHAEHIIPYAYIQRTLASNPSFRKDRMGATNSLKRAIRTLIDRGDIVEVDKATLMSTYNTTSIAYAIKNVGLLR